MTHVYLEELRHSMDGDYWEWWLIPPPDLGVSYRVLDEDWDLDAEPPVRTISSIKVVV